MMTPTPQVAISESFLTGLSKLPKPTQKKVREFTSKFRENPKSSAINYESIAQVRDEKVRTVRIDQTYRAIVVHPPKGNVYLLVWVDHHDDAMDWAKNKVFDIHGTTGALQVVDMQMVEERLSEKGEESPSDAGLFSGLSDGELERTGLPKLLIPAVRGVKSESELEGLEPYLPKEAFEALFFVACGFDLDNAIRESSRPVAKEPLQVDTEDFAAALEAPATKRQFRLVQSEEELFEMLDASLEKWRVFLHPNQEAIIRTNFRGPARVLGGAGTGKTVVAMHRARHLAKKFPEEKVLFMTFDRNLAGNISGLLRGLCGSEFERIDVTNIHAWAAGRWRSKRGNFKIATPADLNSAWSAALKAGTFGDWDADDYKAEWRDVVQFQGVTSRVQYLKASRAGASHKLRRADRAEVWEGLDAFRAELTKRELYEWPDVVRGVREDLGDGDHPYRAVVVDEAQDLSAEDWRLIATLVPDADNNLFITGDAHQRIYGRPIVLGHFGINIRGRSRRLKINYRTTEQVLHWATAQLEGMAVDDLDGGADSIVGYRSLYRGPEPDVRELGSESKQSEFLVRRIRELLDGGAAPEEIAVIARYKNQVSNLAGFVDAAGIEGCILSKEPATGGVRFSTMHRAKGLEFSHVILLMPPSKKATDPRERSLLYVAATRCRKTLTVMS